LDEDEDFTRQTTKSNLYSSLAMTTVFIVCCMIENPVESVFRMHTSIMNTFLAT